MRSKEPRSKSEIREDPNQSARAEIRVFLAALDSYPQQFAAHPGVSFEKHYAESMASAWPAPAQEGASKAHRR